MRKKGIVICGLAMMSVAAIAMFFLPDDFLNLGIISFLIIQNAIHLFFSVGFMTMMLGVV